MIRENLIFFEGSTDKKFAELAYQKIYGGYISKFEIFEPDVSNQNSDIGTGAKNLNSFLRNYASKIHNTRTILGIFDYDEEGINHFEDLLIEDNQKFYPYRTDTSVYRFKGDKNAFYNKIEKNKDAINF